jgi:hypothetical protein
LNPNAGNFHIVNQIIERGLHNSDDEIMQYTTNLVDKLEQVSPLPRLYCHAPKAAHLGLDG